MRKQKIIIPYLFFILSAINGHCSPKQILTSPPKTNSQQIINDNWYTMQAGSTPWGIYHEIIEKRSDGNYSYKYNMTKIENKVKYLENIGAVCDSNLKPIAFNLNKSGSAATEDINATFIQNTTDPSNAQNIQARIKISGAQTQEISRVLNKETILDVFFPLYLSKQWGKLKTGYRSHVQTFAEDPEKRTFTTHLVKFEVKDKNTVLKCTNFKIEIFDTNYFWCMDEKGVVKEIKSDSFYVKKVNSEKEAKDFIKNILPKNESQGES